MLPDDDKKVLAVLHHKEEEALKQESSTTSRGEKWKTLHMLQAEARAFQQMCVAYAVYCLLSLGCLGFAFFWDSIAIRFG